MRDVQDALLVQLALSDQGCDVRADGIFGGVTARFIRAFQRSKELPETGVADAGLIRRLISIGDQGRTAGSLSRTHPTESGTCRS